MGDLIVKAATGTGNALKLQDQAGQLCFSTIDDGGVITDKVNFPAGMIIQTVHGIGGQNSMTSHNGATWTNLETLGTTITVTKGNKVLVFAHSVNWFTSGTNNHNGVVRIQLNDGTNTAETNSVLLWTQNFSINAVRMYGTSHSGILTTASGSGTVVVTAYVQASTEAQATVNYGDANPTSSFGYILQEIQV